MPLRGVIPHCPTFTVATFDYDRCGATELPDDVRESCGGDDRCFVRVRPKVNIPVNLN